MASVFLWVVTRGIRFEIIKFFFRKELGLKIPNPVVPIHILRLVAVALPQLRVISSIGT